MYQKIIIIGNLGRDPEMRYTPSGAAVTNFNVATNRKYTTSDGNPVEQTTWFRVSTWGKQAEACNQFLKKGSKVLVEGRLNPDQDTGGPKVWTKQDGTSGASYEITADQVRFLSSRAEDESGYTTKDSPGISEPEDIPF
ncbi:MAG: single-stranded DNA-binding protein [Anaerolineales bacterium]|nr:single-stranded DNA-binding protein [Anaerolineales bacterium]